MRSFVLQFGLLLLLVCAFTDEPAHPPPPPASRQQMLGGSDDAYVREVSFVDPINQKMTMFSVNLSLSREWAPSARERV